MSTSARRYLVELSMACEETGRVFLMLVASVSQEPAIDPLDTLEGYLDSFDCHP